MSQVISLQRPQRPLNSSDVVNKLNIPPSTLRTYTAHFRRLGHTFQKKNGRILYSTRDVELFKQMMELHEQGFGTIPQCVYNVVNSSNNSEDTMDKVDNQNKQMKLPQDTSSPIDTVDEIARIRKEMEELRKYVDETIKKRDELLLQTLREVLNAKQKKQKKKRWWQFWK
ncbi:TPA: MerR family transcriptional regulator [Bacillus nitratireducens]|nr:MULTISPECIES: MerR family transcriptional regulator [Bacillus cereus group]HDX9575380.1 MerR family transcriptional regulator [Bacillus mobilis]MBL3881511.1 MerR family transcriptional regulator [Bacillus cereus]MEB8984916.1 MerR family transcriptional regulator [Bacillus cereus]MEC2490261.1 MerR family transcriptional regulator [Bacillus cereus]MEC2516421.1 MerR family transcriptional regulator [Bacillus cereus]